MIRSELVARIAAQNPHLYAKDVEAVVATVLDTMTDALARGDRVELRGFGMFEARPRAARVRRNPRTQTAVEVEAGAAVRFKPAKAMKDLLNANRRGREACAQGDGGARELSDGSRCCPARHLGRLDDVG